MSDPLFISLRVRPGMTMHGYDDTNLEIMSHDEPGAFAEKVIAVARVQSATEKYVLVSGSHGRMMYWEYEGGLAALKQKLSDAKLLIG